MRQRFSHDFVKDTYSKNSIDLLSDFRNLYKIIKLKCKLCEYEWDDKFDPDGNQKCPKCFSKTEKVENKSKSGRHKLSKKIQNLS